MRTMAWLVLGLTLAGGPWEALAQEGTARIEARAGAKVNVRSSPDVKAGNVVGRAAGMDEVSVLETAQRQTHAWYRVRGPNGAYEGWIRGDLIADLDLAAQAPAEPAATPAPAPAKAASTPTPAPVPAEVIPTPATPIPAPATDAPKGDAAREVAPPRAEDPPLVERDDWSRYLVDHFAAVRDCLNTSSAQPAAAVKAIPLNRGLVDVVVLDAAARRWECIIKAEGGTPLRYDPMTWQMALPQRSGDPSFTLAGATPPEGACFATEPVNDPDNGRQLGWLTYRTCP